MLGKMNMNLPRNNPILISLYRQLLKQARILDRNPINKCFLIAKPRKVFLRDYEDSLVFRLSSHDLEIIEQIINDHNNGEYYRPAISNDNSIDVRDTLRSIFRNGFPSQYQSEIEKSISNSVLTGKTTENEAYLQKCISFGFHSLKRISGATHLINQLPYNTDNIIQQAFNNPKYAETLKYATITPKTSKTNKNEESKESTEMTQTQTQNEIETKESTDSAKTAESKQMNQTNETNESLKFPENSIETGAKQELNGSYVRVPLKSPISLNSLQCIDINPNTRTKLKSATNGLKAASSECKDKTSNNDFRIEKGMLLVSHPMSCVTQDELYRKVIYIIEAPEDSEYAASDRVVGITLNNAYVMFDINRTQRNGNNSTNQSGIGSKRQAKSGKKKQTSKRKSPRERMMSSKATDTVAAATTTTTATTATTTEGETASETTSTAGTASEKKESKKEKEKESSKKETTEDVDDCFGGWYGEFNYVGGPVSDKSFPFCIMHNNKYFYEKFKSSSNVLVSSHNENENENESDIEDEIESDIESESENENQSMNVIDNKSIYWTWLTFENHETIFHSLLNVSKHFEKIKSFEKGTDDTNMNNNSNSNDSNIESEIKNEKSEDITSDDFKIMDYYDNSQKNNDINLRPMFKFYQQYTAWNYEQLMVEISNNVWFPVKFEDLEEERNLLMLECPPDRKEHKKAFNTWMWQYFIRSLNNEYKCLSVFPEFNESLVREYYDLMHDFHSSWVIDVTQSQESSNGNNSEESDDANSASDNDEDEEDGIGGK